jgi:DNA-binding NarL/FixJ family response regulator
MLTALVHMLQQDFSIVGTVSNGVSVVAEAAHLNPDVILLDISLGDITGFQVAERLRSKEVPSKILFLSVHENPEFVRAAEDMGISGYVFKSQISRDLVDAIDAVAQGKHFFPGGSSEYGSP